MEDRLARFTARLISRDGSYAVVALLSYFLPCAYFSLDVFCILHPSPGLVPLELCFVRVAVLSRVLFLYLCSSFCGTLHHFQGHSRCGFFLRCGAVRLTAPHRTVGF